MTLTNIYCKQFRFFKITKVSIFLVYQYTKFNKSFACIKSFCIWGDNILGLLYISEYIHFQQSHCISLLYIKETLKFIHNGKRFFNQLLRHFGYNIVCFIFNLYEKKGKLIPSSIFLHYVALVVRYIDTQMTSSH